MNSNSNNLCPFYRFPSDFGGPNYEQNKLKIENIRKKVGDMHKITNEK